MRQDIALKLMRTAWLATVMMVGNHGSRTDVSGADRASKQTCLKYLPGFNLPTELFSNRRPIL